MGLLEGLKRDGNGAILYPQAAEATFEVDGRDPDPALAPWVQGYWITRWDRRGLPPFVQRVLPSPSVNLTIKRGRSRVAGLTLGVFTEVLEDRHVVFGVRSGRTWDRRLVRSADASCPSARSSGQPVWRSRVPSPRLLRPRTW